MEYRIAWKNKKTGKSGHGDWMKSYKQAKEWRDFGNNEFSDIFHWIEQRSNQ